MSEVGVILKNMFITWKIIPNKKIWDTFLDYDSRRFCDFWLEKDDINVMVEYDGQQHFRPVRFGGISLKKAKKQLVKQKLIDNLDEKFCYASKEVYYEEGENLFNIVFLNNCLLRLSLIWTI